MNTVALAQTNQLGASTITSDKHKKLAAKSACESAPPALVLTMDKAKHKSTCSFVAIDLQCFKCHSQREAKTN
ncbi:MAG: hypothetical protein AB8A46_04545 [Prochlorococcus sp.]